MSVTGYALGARHEPAGTELTADVAVDATTLPVDWVGLFSDEGGVLSLNDVSLDYESTDDAASIITLTEPLTVPVATGDRVYVIEGGQVCVDYVLDVDLGDGDPVTVPIPYAQRDLWPEGDYDDPVPVVISDDLLSLEEVPGRTPLRDGSFIDPGTIEFPDVSDGLPPASSPTPVVIGGVGVLHVRWDGIANADPVTYEVHVGTVDGFAPSAATLVAETNATAITVRTLADGTPLDYGPEGTPLVYFVRLVAKDVDDAAAPSTQASGSLHRVSNTEISALYGYLGTLSADAITAGTLDVAVTVSGELRTSESGQRVVMDAAGLHLFSPANVPVVDLPTDPSKVASFKGDAEVQNLAVKGSLSVETAGTIGAGAGLELVGGLLAPSTAPTVTLDHEFGAYAVTVPTTKLSGAGNFYVDATAYDATHAYLSWHCDGFTYITKHPIAGGAQVAALDLTSAGATIIGLAIDPADGKLWALNADGELTRYTSALVDDGQTWPNVPTFGVQPFGLAIHNGVAYFGCTGTVNSYALRVVPITLATGAVGASMNGPANSLGPSGSGWAGFAVGPQDYGDATVRFTCTSPSYIVRNYTASGTTLGELVDERWTTDNDGGVGAFDVFGWTGTEHRVVKEVTSSVAFLGPELTVASVLFKRFTGIRWTTESAQWWASHTWRDSDPAGASGTSETDQGKRAAFTMKKRYRLRLGSAVIPDAGGADDPNAVSFYVGRGSTDPGRVGMYLQGGTLPDGVTEATLTGVAFAGTNPPAANDFPGSSPGYIKSGSKRQDGTPKIKLDGLGGANVDGLIPPGTVQMWAGTGSTAPDGWAFCDGAALNTATSPDLFAVIGYTYGGSGTTFNKPNLNDRMPIGAGGARAAGATGGAETKPVPPHTHGAGGLSASDRSLNQNTNTSNVDGTRQRLTGPDTHTHTISGSTAGASGSAFDVMPPWLALRFIIKL